jgi:hypothetical protein
MITESCEKVALPDGRETLVCEDSDAGMGHDLYDLYSVDPKNPAGLNASLLVRVDSFADDCVVHRRVVKGIVWSPDRRTFSVDVEPSEWERLSDEPDCKKQYDRESVGPPRITFSVSPEGNWIKK